MTKVKICGITNLDDAMYAIECGADALGFVFYEKSHRYITPYDAREIIDRLPPFIEKVGLFVERSAEDIETISYESHITLAQIHFDVDEKFLDDIAFPALPVVRARKRDDIYKFEDRYRLIDAYTQEYGGSGKRLALEWFEENDNSKIILAGGLDAQNVRELSGYGFYGVDASSGTELSKGVKDPDKIREFIANAKSI